MTRKKSGAGKPRFKEFILSRLGDDFVDRLGTLHTNQALLETTIKVTQVVRIKAKLLEHCGVHVLDVERLLDSGAAKFIRLPNTHAALDATARHPRCEAIAIVITTRALGILSRWLATKLTTPNDQCLVEHPALLKILQQARDRLVSVAGVVVVILLQIAVGVPVGVVVVASGIYLNEANTPLDQAAGEQTFFTKVTGPIVIQSIQVFDMLRFAVEVHRLGGTHLHLVRQLVTRDSGGQGGVVDAITQVATVVLVQLVDQKTLLLAAHVAGILQVEDRG